MLDSRSKLFAEFGVGAIISFLTIASIIRTASSLRKSHPKGQVYQDKDGVSTQTLDAAYTCKVPKAALVVFSVLGLSVSIALAALGVLGSRRKDATVENWLIAGDFFLLTTQAAGLVAVRSSVISFALGIYATTSSIFILAILLYQCTTHIDDQNSQWNSPELVLRLTQLVSAIGASVAGLSIPRRPQVLHDGCLVDDMYTVSAIESYSFSWVSHLLKLARSSGRLELKDLPKMSHLARSSELNDKWKSRVHIKKLWVEIFLAYRSMFVIQWLLTLFQAIGVFAPQFVAFHILQILEERVPGTAVDREAWLWVIGLTGATVTATLIDSWLYWISWAEIAIPLRSQLTSLIFQKSLRRKDVHGAANYRNKTASTPSTRCKGIATEDLPIKKEEKANAKGKQSTVNLISIDAKRVSDFTSYNNYLAGCLFKLTFSFAFLLKIIGWKALLAGVFSMSLTIPLNIFFTRRYSSAQKRLAKMRDLKVTVITEALQGIRQIKFSALEQNWHEKIGNVRSMELKELWNVYIANTVLAFCWITSPIALSAVALAVYSYEYGHLIPSVAFTAIGVFSALERTLSTIPELITQLVDAYISVDRVEKHLSAPEVIKKNEDAPNISFNNASIAWASDEVKTDDDNRYILRDLNISFPPNELSVISGRTGSGKSLLLASILGEVDILSGTINVPCAKVDRYDDLATKDNWIIPQSIAYVAQIPWIQNASIRDNILFGLPLDEYRYKKVLKACALKQDLAMLPDGERTEIGAKGINLSGGQRWRVTFARALYSRAGILILDDIFSAVDAHVGRYIFEKGLMGELGAGRTRILVTHHVALVKSKTEYIVELGDGTVEHAGRVADLENDGTLQEIIRNDEAEEDEIGGDQLATAVNSEDNSDAEDTQDPHKSVELTRIARKFVEDEIRMRGKVKKEVYATYLKGSGGWPFWIGVMVAYATLQCLVTGRTWWLRIWTDHDQNTPSFSKNSSAPSYTFQTHILLPPAKSTFDAFESERETLHYYLGIYVLISVFNAIIGAFRCWLVFSGGIRASRRLFDNLSFTVLRTPLRWMDTVPLGRILNRFTADFNVVDSKLSLHVAGSCHDLFRLFGVVVAGTFVSPYVIILALCLLSICIHIARLYICGAREVKRLESTTKSPVIDLYTSTLTGIITIRAFDKEPTFINRMYRSVDDHTTSYWHIWAFNRWMGWRMGLVGSLFATFVAIMVLVMTHIDASLAGFALSFALEYGSTVIWTIRNYANIELDMNAAERIMEYTNLPIERMDGIAPPAAWPSEGRLEVHNLVVSYAPDLPAVLKGLTFTVERNERIGVVGRTGAGKSSLTLALFRFLEASEGSIYIDGIDISTVKLHSLRSRLAIIPQDPVLFSGTIRSNLDAFDQHTDAELHDALERVHLVFTSTPPSPDPNTATPPTNVNQNHNPFLTLSSPITEGGLNLSQGQRQLLCLARAIVSRPKIMVLDEATSAVDMATDTLIQRSIREEFKDSTLIVIAHRLSTIADFDRILVLDEGVGVEFGSPKELMRKEVGVFRGMVRECGEGERLERDILEGGD